MDGAGTTSVVVVTHDSGATLARCAQTLLSQATPDGSALPLELIVVDNASRDDGLRALPVDPRVRLVCNAHNVGFGTACNRGAALARGDVLLFLNPDCFLPPDAIARMRARLHDRMILGAALLDADGTPQRTTRRRTPTPLRAIVRALGVERRGLGQGVDDVGADGGDIEALSGALMMMPRAVFASLDGFDESYVLHCEDLDLCRRARAEGIMLDVADDVRVVHLKGTSSTRRPLWVEWHKHRGMWRYFRKFDAATTPAWLQPVLWLGLWAHFAVAALRRLLAARRPITR